MPLPFAFLRWESVTSQYEESLISTLCPREPSEMMSLTRPDRAESPKYTDHQNPPSNQQCSTRVSFAPRTSMPLNPSAPPTNPRFVTRTLSDGLSILIRG